MKDNPVAIGALMSSSLLAGFGWLLGYTLGPLPGQGALGDWNYLVSVFFLVGFVAGGSAWHGGSR